MTLVHSPEALRAGPLAGQDLSLLTERSVLLVRSYGDQMKLATFLGPLRKGHDGPLVVDEEGQGRNVWRLDRFDYIGERQDDGFIAAPEGGWESNPVPGRRIDVRQVGYAGVGESYLSDNQDWRTTLDAGRIEAFRLAGEAVSIPEGEGVHPRGWSDPFSANYMGEEYVQAEERKDRRGSLPAQDEPSVPTEEPSPPVVGSDLEEAIRLLSRIVRVYGDMQDGAGNTPTEIRKAERFILRMTATGVSHD